MNERIRELAEQAEIYMGQDSYGKFAVIPGHEKDSINRQGKTEAFDALEKFAELIVKECITLGTNFTNRNYSDDAGERIAKHFGVEE